MHRIRPLDAQVVNQIAAGEVIERPASAVKELLENSIDALATHIEVDVAQGGTESIRLVDNGEGIHPDDLVLAVTSHATNKIRSADDLFRVQTMGFRGEALASMASVSRLLVRSRQADQDHGYELQVEAGRIGEVRPCAAPLGTQIEIRQLFLNTPVRRKFLKSTSTEFGHISEQFTRMALAHPRMHAVLRHNGKTVYELPPAGQLIDRLRFFFGSELTDKLIWVESQTDSARLWGYVAHPSQSKATRKGQSLFLNGRFITDRSLQHALQEAYRGLLMVGRYPIAFLFLELDPDLVDVNVHPTKAEVRFRDSQPIYRQLLSTLRTTFLGMDLESQLSLPARGGAAPTGRTNDLNSERAAQLQFVSWAKDRLTQWTPGSSQRPEPHAGDGPHSADATGSAAHDDAAPVQGAAEAADAAAEHPLAGREVPAGPSGSWPAPPESVGAALDGGGQSGLPAKAGRLSGPQMVMQIHNCYLVLETGEGLTVIDQHALHERVLYEQLRERVLSGAVESQRLLVPQSIELSPAEASILLEHVDALAQLGFEVAEFGKQTVLLTAYPALLRRADPVQLVRDIVDQLVHQGQGPTRRDILDGLLHTMACKAAVKAGQPLTVAEMESLLEQRHLIDDAHHCPHGRPTALVLTRAELDRQFGRLGS